MKKWVNKKRKVEVYFKKIFIKLKPNSFKRIWEKRLENEKNYIEPIKAIRFIEENTVGGITKGELDDERIKEINGLDMMQNSSIVHHPESIIEVQIIAMSLFCFYEYATFVDGDIKKA